MPVEIKELIVKVVTGNEQRPGERMPLRQRREEETENMIRECVERVLEVLKKEEQR
jgi:hypothetical protein